MSVSTRKMLSSADTRAKRQVRDCAEVLKRFHFLQKELVRGLAGWAVALARWEPKVAVPKHLWFVAEHATALRARVFELRFPSREMTPGPDAPLIELFGQLIHAPDEDAYLCALYRHCIPAIREGLEQYLKEADVLDDAPTHRIATQIVAECGLMEREASPWLRAPSAGSPGAQWLGEIARRLSAFGSILDGPLQIDATGPIPHARRFQMPKTPQRDPRFPTLRFYWPDLYQKLPLPPMNTEMQLRQAVAHYNELWASEAAAYSLYHIMDELDWEFVPTAARWCFDEMRHCLMGFQRMKFWGVPDEMIPSGTFMGTLLLKGNPIEGVLALHSNESRFIATKKERTKLFGDVGDRLSSHDMDFDWADEQLHATWGHRWLKRWLELKEPGKSINDLTANFEARELAARQSVTKADEAVTGKMYFALLEKFAPGDEPVLKQGRAANA